MNNPSIKTTIFSPKGGPACRQGRDAAGRGGLKKFVIIFSLSFFLCSTVFAQQYGWVDISSNVPNFPGDTIILNEGQDTLIAGFRSICFLDDDEGWISTQVFDSCVVLHTVNGGDSWEIQEIPFPELIIAIDMQDSQHGYAASAEGTIFHSNNGGETWDFHGPTFALVLSDMDFPIGSDTGYACGMNGAIFRITPTGVENMVSGVVSDLSSIFFLSPDHGWVCGESIVKEYANGEWVAGHAYNSGHWNDIFFVDELKGWGAGMWLTFPLDTVGILHTTNDSSWFSQPLSIGNMGDMSQVFFLDNLHGWAIHFSGKIYTTSDGGNSWSEQSPGISSEILTNIQMTSLSNGYICGNNRTLLKYTQLTSLNKSGYDDWEITIFPNPVKDKFKVQSIKPACWQGRLKVENATIELFDLNGRILMEKHFPAGSETAEIDGSGLQNGIYLVRIQFANQMMTKKLIIQH